MQREPVALAVHDQRPHAVGPDRVHTLGHLAPQRHDLVHRVADPPVHIQIHQRPLAAADRVGPGHQAPPVAVLVVQHRELEAVERFLGALDPQHPLVEPARAIEIGNGDIHPDETVVLAVEVGHMLIVHMRLWHSDPNR